MPYSAASEDEHSLRFFRSDQEEAFRPAHAASKRWGSLEELRQPSASSSQARAWQAGAQPSDPGLGMWPDDALPERQSSGTTQSERAGTPDASSRHGRTTAADIARLALQKPSPADKGSMSTAAALGGGGGDRL